MDINFNALAWLLIVGQTDRPQFCPVLPVIRSYLHSSACRTLLACITMQIVVAGFEMQDALGAVVNDALFSITHAYATRPSQAPAERWSFDSTTDCWEVQWWGNHLSTHFIGVLNWRQALKSGLNKNPQIIPLLIHLSLSKRYNYQPANIDNRLFVTIYRLSKC